MSPTEAAIRDMFMPAVAEKIIEAAGEAITSPQLSLIASPKDVMIYDNCALSATIDV